MSSFVSTPLKEDKPEASFVSTPMTEDKPEQRKDEWKPLGISPPRNIKFVGDKDKEKEYAPLEEVSRWMEEDGFGYYVLDNNKDALIGEDRKKQILLYFLYGRGYMAMPPCRKANLKEVRLCLQEDASDRLALLVGTGDPMDKALHDNSVVMRDWEIIQRAVLRYPYQRAFKGGKAMTIFVKHKIAYTGIIQTSKCCSLAATAAVLSHLHAMSKEEQEEMERYAPWHVDATGLCRNCLSDEWFKQRVVGNKGGQSAEILQAMLPVANDETKSLRLIPYGLYMHMDEKKYLKTCANIRKKLVCYGPALVSGFNTNEHFRKLTMKPEIAGDGSIQIPQLFLADNGDECYKYVTLMPSERANEDVILRTVCKAADFELIPELTCSSSDSSDSSLAATNTGSSLDTEDGKIRSLRSEEERMNNPSDPSHHAMVMVGCRIEKEGKRIKDYYFLIQNSHKSKPLFEVSGRFLQRKISDCGLVQFVTGTVATLPKTLTSCPALMTETAIDDGGESDQGFHGNGGWLEEN